MIAPTPQASCAEASEASAPSTEIKPSAPQASEASVTRKGGGIGVALAALAEDGIKAGHVVTWIGASGNVVRFGRDGRARKFGKIED